LHKTGGACALAIGVGYILIIALYVPMGAPPNDVRARLAHLASHTAAWWMILGLSVLTDVLFAPLALSLYEALKQFNRNLMLLASLCVALFIVLDLSVTWTNYAALITISGKFASEGSETQKFALIVAAEYPNSVLQSRLLFVYNSLSLGVGICATGFVMLRARFGKTAAYLGVATGGAGIIAVAGSFFSSSLASTIVFASVLTTAWVMFVGYKLLADG
jgi:hypothetical protein